MSETDVREVVGNKNVANGWNRNLFCCQVIFFPLLFHSFSLFLFGTKSIWEEKNYRENVYEKEKKKIALK